MKSRRRGGPKAQNTTTLMINPALSLIYSQATATKRLDISCALCMYLTFDLMLFAVYVDDWFAIAFQSFSSLLLFVFIEG